MMARTATKLEADVCVIGGGPAGATLATRLVQLGHDVCLIERAAYPRRHLGESLTPGVRTLLEVTGADGLLDAAGAKPVVGARLDWDRGSQHQRFPPDAGAVLVDRGRFDALLLEHAARTGVRVLQPMTARRPCWRGDAWMIAAESRSRRLDVNARFLVEANGRSACTRARERRTGPATVALFAYWRARKLPEEPCIEARENAWFWGVPLPDGTYNALAFVDQAELRSRRGESLGALYRRLTESSTVLAELSGPQQDSPARAIDATAYLDEASASPQHLKIGDAALALDPISSSGVQKALQTAVTGAIVVNTLLRRPEDSAAATAFHRDNLARAFERHMAWARAHYARVAARRDEAFWKIRAAASAAVELPEVRRADAHLAMVSPAAVRLSALCEFVDIPCADGSYIKHKTGLRHPAIAEPIAFLGGWELVPLLRVIPPGIAPLPLAQRWAARVPTRSAIAMIGWLLERGVLELDGTRPSGGGRVPAAT